jgi:DNA-directed RNA polymerase sigma subunit (sigma70/sigma32)
MSMRQLKISKSITNRESQSLEKYLQEIGRVELIKPEEEEELAKQLKLEIITGSTRFYSDNFSQSDPKSEVKFKFTWINDEQIKLPINLTGENSIEENFKDFKNIKLIDKSNEKTLLFIVNNKDDASAKSHIFNKVKYDKETGNIEIMFSETKYSETDSYSFVKMKRIKGTCSL